MESTASLLVRVRGGDRNARDRLIGRYLPTLLRWAHGRVAPGARDLIDTADVVQMTLIRALDRLEQFEPRREGAFLAYLRAILLNQIRDQARRAGRSPARGELTEDLPHPAPSPLEEAIGRETLERYEAALSLLTPEQREAVVLRAELGFTYPEIAEAMGSPSANAARMLVTRGLVRMAEVMDGSR
jgi:RNA polymerase sigma-70 factor, ECF subfamily